MALTLIKEDGTGKVDSNSYASAADGDAYYDGHLYASAWTAATTANKERALVFATRLIDSQVQFNGWRAHDEQALQWPREGCPDPDRGLAVAVVLRLRAGNFVDSDIVPKSILNATCEMARELLIADRTAAPVGEGIDSVQTAHASHDGSGSGSSSDGSATKYSKSDARPIISYVAQAMLVKYGALVKASGAVRLVRA
jgi:hypothetical protein